MNWIEQEVKTLNTWGYFEINSMFWSAVQRLTFFFLTTCNALKIWFELSRVKLYRKDLKGNINYSELAGSSSYRGFELPRVKLQ